MKMPDIVMPTGWHPLSAVGVVLALAGTLLLAEALSRQGLADGAARGDPARQLLDRNAAIAARLQRLPPATEADSQWALVGELATEHGIVVRGTQYPEALPRSGTLFERLPIRMRFESNLDGARAFLAGLQRELPALAIERFDLARSSGESGRYEGELRGHLVTRVRP